MDTSSLLESTFIASGKDNDSQGAVSGRRTSVTMEEVEDEDAMNHGFAPGGDADYFAEEDDDGRFFGGGLTSEQKEILNIFDNATNNEDDGVRCLLTWNSQRGSDLDFLSFKICLSLTFGNLCYFLSVLLTRTKTNGLNIPITHLSLSCFFQIQTSSLLT